MKKRIFTVFFVNALIVAMVGIAFGLSSYLSQFNTRYSTSGTALNTCTLCHLGSPATANNLNPYGNDFLANGHNYAAIEALDSDGDGFSNLTEIQARTFPGDPASRPAADAVPPTVTGFTVPASSTSLTVTISTLTATDNVAVTDYLVTETATVPAAAAAGWSATPPTSYTFATAGAKTLYAWAKDAAGNVSTSRSASVTISPTDTTAPTVTTFTIPSTSNSLTVVITALIATDNVGVAGYLITESATAPSAGAAGWSPTPPVTYRVTTAGANTLYAWAKDATGNVSTGRSAPVTVNPTTPTNAPAVIGLFRGGTWFGDENRNGIWDGCVADSCLGPFGGFSIDIPVAADWTGNGSPKIGIYRQGMWYLDKNGNGLWDGCTVDSCLGPFGGVSIDLPVAGDWTGTGLDKIGIYRQGIWYLDKNGNGLWDGCTVDSCIGPFGGYAVDIPVAGDWTGDGITKIGIYRQGLWYLDKNGNGMWDGCAVDTCVDSFGGLPMDKPVVGDWTGDGKTKIGIYQYGFYGSLGVWYLDKNGNGTWDDCTVDTCVSFGWGGDIPIVK